MSKSGKLFQELMEQEPTSFEEADLMVRWEEWKATHTNKGEVCDTLNIQDVANVIFNRERSDSALECVSDEELDNIDLPF